MVVNWGYDWRLISDCESTSVPPLGFSVHRCASPNITSKQDQHVASELDLLLTDQYLMAQLSSTMKESLLMGFRLPAQDAFFVDIS